MTTVSIDRDRAGWFYFATPPRGAEPREVGEDEKSARAPSYDQILARAAADGHVVDNAGWKYKLLMWNWHSVSLDGYPGWEIESQGSPAWCRLEHVNKRTKGSDDLCRAWDDIAKVQFYTRDWSYDGSVFVNEGERYASGWWFRTAAERDRFLAWVPTVDAKVRILARRG